MSHLFSISDFRKEIKEIQKQNRAFRVIQKYINSDEKVSLFQPRENQDIVWQFWEPPKNTNNDPVGLKLVTHCLESVQKNIWTGYKRELLDLSKSKEYVEFPEFVYQKLENNSNGFGLTPFSDILRLALLYIFGGIWLDATILTLRPLERMYLSYRCSTGFSFARSQDVKYFDRISWRHCNPSYFSWNRFSRVKWLNSFIVSGKNKETIIDLDKITYDDFNYFGDENGYFEYLTKNGNEIKYRLLTHEIEEEVLDKILNLSSTEYEDESIWDIVRMLMASQTVSVNGNEDTDHITSYINKMDIRELASYLNFVMHNTPRVNIDIRIGDSLFYDIK